MTNTPDQCKHCVIEFDPITQPCLQCTFNTNVKNNFISKNEYYPLELKGDHIHLCEIDGTKYTIALFRADKDGDWDLRFIGNRPMDEKVNWKHFRKLIEIGFKQRINN